MPGRERQSVRRQRMGPRAAPPDATASDTAVPDAAEAAGAMAPTIAQRRADALGMVAECALAGGLDKGTAGDRYQVVVHVDADALADGGGDDEDDAADARPGESAAVGGGEAAGRPRHALRDGGRVRPHRRARQGRAAVNGNRACSTGTASASARTQATPAWRGERLDVDWAVSVLWRPRGDAAGRAAPPG